MNYSNLVYYVKLSKSIAENNKMKNTLFVLTERPLVKTGEPPGRYIKVNKKRYDDDTLMINLQFSDCMAVSRRSPEELLTSSRQPAATTINLFKLVTI